MRLKSISLHKTLKTINGVLPLLVIPNLDRLIRKKKMDLKLITFSNNLCTTGNLYRTYDDCVHADELICHTMELPWLDNKTFISCIPAGDYVIQMVVSPTHGNVYKIKDVVGRTHILFHVANKPSQLEGCIAPCMDFGVLDGEWAGLSSERAFTKLMNLLGGEKHNLKIRRF